MTGLLIHEWLESHGGSEQVFREFLGLYPDADAYVLWKDSAAWSDKRIRESWLAGTPLRAHKALAIPAMTATWPRVPSKDVPEWLLVSSHAFAHHARAVRAPDAPKIVYVHSPARYLWEPNLDARGAGFLHALVRPSLQNLDRRRAAKATTLLANSQFVSARINNVWGLDAEVVYPPVEVERLSGIESWAERLDGRDLEQFNSLPDHFVTGASRFVPYKRLDLVIAAAERLGVGAVLMGSGPEEKRLQHLAESSKVPVVIIQRPSDELMYAVIQRSEAFVFPAVEDFGILPVEAQALGTAIVTGPVGGQIETFVPGVTGVVADSVSPGDLANAIEAALHLDRFDGHKLTKRFSPVRFRSEIRSSVTKAVGATSSWRSGSDQRARDTDQ